jgi:aspartate racemase
MVVYEMAQQLRKQGETIGLLALVDPTTPLSKPASPSGQPIRAHLLTIARLRGNQESIRGNIMNISHAILNKVLGGIQWRWHKLHSTSWNKIRKILCNIYFRFRYPLPTFLRRFYRDIVVKQAARQYSPQNYPGQIVIFQTKIFVETYWRKLCAEVVQVYDLSCKHEDIYLDRPHTSTFLNQLMNHLEKAPKN